MVSVEEVGEVKEEENKATEEMAPAEEEKAADSSASGDGATCKVEEAKSAEPAAPAGPEIKLSQIAPMLVMFGLQKYDIEELGYVRHVEVGFIVVQVLCAIVLFMLYRKVDAMSPTGQKLKVPEVKQFGQVVTPSIEQTPREYDMSKLLEQVKQAGIGAVVLGCVYYKWRYVMPLVLQIIMTPMQLYESPLFQVHLMGKTIARPYPAVNPFGLPTAAAPPAEQSEGDAGDADAKVEDKKDK